MTEFESRTTTAERKSGLGISTDSLALAGLGIAAAGSLLAARPAQAATFTTHLTLYFDTSPGTGAIQVPGTGDIKVLNYALALETLEAELYRQAYARLTGSTYDGSAATDQFGNAITGLGIATTAIDAEYLKTFGVVEAQHRDFLTQALNGNWVTNAGAKFDFNINNLDRSGVDELIYAAELTGVSAYLGAIPSFATKTYLPVAAAILGTEARHTSAVAVILNTLAGSGVVETAPLKDENTGRDTPLTPDQILNTGGAVPTGITVGRTGVINPVSGANGFVVM